MILQFDKFEKYEVLNKKTYHFTAACVSSCCSGLGPGLRRRASLNLWGRMTSLGSLLGQCAAIICGVNVFQLYNFSPDGPPVPTETGSPLLKVLAAAFETQTAALCPMQRLPFGQKTSEGHLSDRRGLSQLGREGNRSLLKPLHTLAHTHCLVSTLLCCSRGSLSSCSLNHGRGV